MNIVAMEPTGCWVMVSELIAALNTAVCEAVNIVYPY
jgi:hypothetical protein